MTLRAWALKSCFAFCWTPWTHNAFQHPYVPSNSQNCPLTVSHHPKKSHLVSWFSVSPTVHTKHLIILGNGLVNCRDVMATKEPLHFPGLVFPPFTCMPLKKIILWWRNLLGVSNRNPSLPQSYTTVTYLVSFTLPLPPRNHSHTNLLLIHRTFKRNRLNLVSSFYIFLILSGKGFYWSMNVMTFPRWWQL